MRFEKTHLADIDGDGNEEIMTIEPFHGNTIHVYKLKEGWDVNNLFTIIPLNAAKSDILAMQTIGRGLRLPFGEQTGNEGCLSVPGKCGVVTRPLKVKVKTRNMNWEWEEIEGEELFARAMLHEMDHLDGILYVDKVEGELMDVEAPEED